MPVDIVANFKPSTLAEFESLVPESNAGKKVLIHTIRDYMPFFDQAVITSASDGTRDVGQIITEYPEGELRAYNEGWGSSQVMGRPVAYETAMIRTRNEIDIEVLKKKGADADTYRLRRDQAFMRGLARQAVRKVFYGDRTSDGRDVLGLQNIVKYGTEFESRIIDAGGSTANAQSEIWLIDWDEEAMHLTIPQGSEAPGVFMDPIEGEQYAFDKNGKRFRAKITEFGWDLGVSVFDPLKIVRVVNVDTTKLSKSHTTAGSADLVDLLTQAVNLLPNGASGKCAFYMNETLTGILTRQMQNRPNNQLGWDTIAGRKVIAWGDIPVHKLGSDVLFNKNAVVAK